MWCRASRADDSDRVAGDFRMRHHEHSTSRGHSDDEETALANGVPFVRERHRQRAVEYRRRFAKIDAVLLGITSRLLRVPSERHRISLRRVALLSPWFS